MPGPQDKEVDFSNYFKNQPKSNSAKSNTLKSKSPSSGNKRMIFLVIVLIALSAALGYVLYQNSQGKVVSVPAGYRLVAPPNQPARLEKIK